MAGCVLSSKFDPLRTAKNSVNLSGAWKDKLQECTELQDDKHLENIIMENNSPKWCDNEFKKYRIELN